MKIGRYGRYRGKRCLFTHRNPATGEVWTDDVVGTSWGGFPAPGCWVRAESVRWID